MLIVGLVVLALWVGVVAIVVGLCISAAHGDRAARRQVARGARVHTGSRLRLTA